MSHWLAALTTLLRQSLVGIQDFQVVTIDGDNESSKGATIRCIDWLEESEGWTSGGNGRNNRVSHCWATSQETVQPTDGYDGSSEVTMTRSGDRCFEKMKVQGVQVHLTNGDDGSLYETMTRLEGRLFQFKKFS
ncbi:hypothetical protein HAX54_020617, partial [Datura stramonium]|nr:hypothetical protein [Datura stramonium]